MQYSGEVLSFISAILWGFAIVLFKKSGETIHPIALNLFKDFMAFILFIPTMIIFGVPFINKAPIAHFLIFFLSGIVGITVGDTLFFGSLNLLGASLAGIVYCLYSPFVVGLSVIVLGERLSALQGFGIFLIILAVFIVTYKKGRAQVSKRKTILGILFGILANLAFAIGIVIIKPLLGNYPVLWSTEVRLFGGIIGLLLILVVHPSRRLIISSLHTSKESWKYTLGGSFFGAYLSMLTWLSGMKYTLASIASALNQTNTVFVFLFAILILKEPFNRKRAISVVLAVAGALLVSLG